MSDTSKSEKGVSMRFGWVVVLGIVLLAGQTGAAEKMTLKTQKEKLSYIIGVEAGNNMKKQSVDIDADILLLGLKDSLSGGPLLLSEDEMVAVKLAFRQEMMAKQAEAAKKLAEKNKKEGDAFLEENKKKEGVKTLPSGLQYKVIQEGTGKTPAATDTVTVNYRGTFIDGQEFDSSYKGGQPATLPVNGVIPAWNEALQLMKEGSKWQIVVPPSLAYGEQGAGNVIGPNAVLIFEVELISVK